MHKILINNCEKQKNGKYFERIIEILDSMVYNVFEF